MQLLLLRYGEIFLKGGNKYQFLKSLVSNIKAITHHNAKITQGRIIMEYFEDHHLLQNVFGLTSYSVCEKIETEVPIMITYAIKFLSFKSGTFRIDTKRSDKRFPITSVDLNRLIGEEVEKNTSLQFSLKDATNILHIEINTYGTFCFCDENTFSCHGGLPSGIEGRVGLLLEDELSELAGVCIMRRGCSVYPIYLNTSVSSTSFSRESITLSQTKILSRYSPSPIHITSLNSYSDIDNFIVEKKLSCLIVSSTNLTPRNYPLSCVILHPLVCESSQKIMELQNKYC